MTATDRVSRIAYTGHHLTGSTVVAMTTDLEETPDTIERFPGGAAGAGR